MDNSKVAQFLFEINLATAM